MSNKTAIVTGAGRGIGRAICIRLAREGITVVAVARTENDLDETKTQVEQTGGICITHPANVASLDDVNEMVECVVNQCGGADILVNNAGVAPNAPMDKFDTETFDAMIAVNVSGVFYCCRAVWPVMRKRGHGIIINISSVAAQDPFPGFAAYGATKNFVEGLTRGLAKEGAPHGIRVFAVGPGAVDTDMLRGPFPDFPADQCLQPDDIAEMVWTLTLPACQHSAGQTIYVRKE